MKSIEKNSEPRRAYTAKEAFEILRLSRNAGYEAIKTGAIPSIKIGSKVLVPCVALDRLLGGEGARA